ncbi:hypothetical protein SERLA73DRAFT_182374 [Serpula lacrymans var. lacrymans S7.3]|uniref:Uncharacterized protein n=2 Tax=Serpula lacrymans var. lacrymans TaxID=341189 RepID=F8PX24_SERL3|nr:uncharacterized protein SERLADRAFT_468987 [Serpula lacrymans var. lacrymans S7.9]EGN99403.1 hypothetical protein SERLA73DRAFT_182374 [Serpula lacrymans var. lacrymans S7.3]EGO24967.1 hypothetical protein SERLADRAFT_468987 [Serpula lacrymans var. lacrymans S7.9]
MGILSNRRPITMTMLLSRDMKAFVNIILCHQCTYLIPRINKIPANNYTWGSQIEESILLYVHLAAFRKCSPVLLAGSIGEQAMVNQMMFDDRKNNAATER